MSKTRTEPSSKPHARTYSVGWYAHAREQPLGISNSTSCAWLPSSSHTRIEPSHDAVANSRLCGSMREAVDDVRVRAHDRRVLERRHVEHADRARRGADQQLEAVGRRVDGRDRALVLGLEEVRREVERPHAQLAVGGAGDGEAGGEVDGVDRALVQRVHVLERARARVDHEEPPGRAADEEAPLADALAPAAAVPRPVERQREEGRARLVLQRHAAAVQLAAAQPPEAHVLVAARDELRRLAASLAATRAAARRRRAAAGAAPRRRRPASGARCSSGSGGTHAIALMWTAQPLASSSGHDGTSAPASETSHTASSWWARRSLPTAAR